MITIEILDFRCSYLPVSILSTNPGVKSRDAKRVSPHISSELCKCASHDNYSWQNLMEKDSERPLTCLDLKVRALKDPDELDPDTLL